MKNPPTVQETWVGSLGWEDPLEEEMVPHASILAWEVPWTEDPGGLQSMGHKESDTTERLGTGTHSQISPASLGAHQEPADHHSCAFEESCTWWNLLS